MRSNTISLAQHPPRLPVPWFTHSLAFMLQRPLTRIQRLLRRSATQPNDDPLPSPARELQRFFIP
jgi:hypothetical protein